MTRLRHRIALLATVLFVGHQASTEAQSRLVGAVTNANGQVLTNANVQLLGTRFGTITDLSGRYVLNHVAAGTYSARATHLGYKPATREVVLRQEEALVVDFALEEDVFVIEGVVVVGQIIGAQAQALNAQKEALNIKNVVADEQFGRFADFNAAETLQRLPGIAIDRDQGEGEFVHVRGLSAQLNSVTVNGKRIPSSTASPEEGRAVGMDIIQSNNIEFIEVTKTLTPDMDADAMGGAINLVLRRPSAKAQYAFSLAGGWNDKTARFDEWGSEIGQFSSVASRRFVDGKVGLIATGNFYRTNRGALLNEIAYAEPGSDAVSYHRWDNYDVQRQRSGALLGADYRFSQTHEIRLNLTWNRFLDDEIRRRREFTPGASAEFKETRNRREDQRFILADVAGTYHLRQWKLDYSVAAARSSEELPDRTYFRFDRTNDFLDQEGGALSNEELLALDLEAAFPGLAPFALYRNRYDNEKTTERELTAAGDAEYSFAFRSEESSAKSGFKVARKKREASDRRWQYIRETADIALAEDEFGFLDVKYDDAAAVELFPLSQYTKEPQLFNYEAQETIYAGYAMTTLNWTSRFSTLVGVRGELTTHAYVHQLSAEESDEGYSNILPSAHLIYRFDERSNLRLALTTGLARPDYLRLLPVTIPNLSDGEILQGNPDLQTTRSYGADLMFETYPRPLGLISAGLFAKRLVDPVVERNYPQEVLEQTFRTRQSVNGESGYVLGLELSLVQPLSLTKIALLRYLGIYSNYTYAFSEVDYGDVRDRDGPLTGSARHALNGGLFYDNEPAGISFTLSASYRAPMFKELGNDPRNDIWFGEELHLDLSANRRLSAHLDLFLKLNNLSNESRREIYGDPYGEKTQPTQFHEKETYGRSGVLGISYRL
jgi:TonB-dependent receptor